MGRSNLTSNLKKGLLDAFLEFLWWWWEEEEELSLAGGEGGGSPPLSPCHEPCPSEAFSPAFSSFSSLEKKFL